LGTKTRLPRDRPHNTNPIRYFEAVMQSIGSPLMWSLFAAFVVVALAIDFFAMSKQGAHRVSTKEAAIWSLI
jgi:hypothetical protein